MSDRYEVRMKSGEVLSAWVRLHTRESFIDPLGSYEFAFSPPRSRRAEFRKLLQRGQIVELFCNGAKQGRVLVVDSNEKLGKAGHTFDFKCESLLATAMEGCVDPNIGASLGADTAASEIVLKALRPYGFTEIRADAAALVSALTGKAVKGRGKDIDVEELKHKQSQAQPGEPTYPFCARIFSRLGCALGVDNEGRLMLRRPDYSQAAHYSVAQSGGGADRFLLDPAAEIHATNKGQFSEYIVSGKNADQYGQTSVGAVDGGVMAEGNVRPSGIPYESLPLAKTPRTRATYSAPDAPYKPRIRLDKKARDRARSEAIAGLLRGIHAADAWRFTCSVRGWVSVSGAVWTVDTIARVHAEDFDLDEELWVSEVERTIDRENGPRTDLTLLPKGALLLGEESGGA